MNLRLIAAMSMLLLLGMVCSPSMEAQKKSKKQAAAQQQKEEQSSDESATMEQAPPPSTSATGGVLDILKKYAGQKTNLGILKKVTRDYFELESDNTVMTVPLGSVHSLRQVTEQDENDRSETHLEIRLVGKD